VCFADMLEVRELKSVINLSTVVARTVRQCQSLIFDVNDAMELADESGTINSDEAVCS